MDTIGEKVNFFKKIVLDKIDSEYDTLENSLEQSFQSEIEAYKAEARQKSQNYTKKFITKAEHEKKIKILEAKREQKEEILTVKNKLIERIYTSVLDKAKGFIGTEQYYSLIQRLIKKGADELKAFDSYKIELCDQDYQNKEKIEEIIKEYLGDKPYSFEVASEDFNGGLIIMNENESIKLDLSLQSIILRKKVFIGNEVQRLLNENGDKNE